jgi:ketosteroid isomerase-like protein
VSENLDLVRSIYAGWERGDFSTVEWADPNIEFVVAAGPTADSYTGVTGIAEGFGRFLGTWEQYQVEADEYRALDDVRVLVLLHQSGRGRVSGIELRKMRTRGATLFHVRGGKVTRLVIYPEGEPTPADLGLAE